MWKSTKYILFSPKYNKQKTYVSEHKRNNLCAAYCQRIFREFRCRLEVANLERGCAAIRQRILANAHTNGINGEPFSRN